VIRVFGLSPDKEKEIEKEEVEEEEIPMSKSTKKSEDGNENIVGEKNGGSSLKAK